MSDLVLMQQSPGSLKDVIQVLGCCIFNRVRQKFNPAPATKKILIFIKYLRKLPLGWVDLRSLKIAAFIATFAICVARQSLSCAVILILQEGYFTS